MDLFQAFGSSRYQGLVRSLQSLCVGPPTASSSPQRPIPPQVSRDYPASSRTINLRRDPSRSVDGGDAIVQHCSYRSVNASNVEVPRYLDDNFVWRKYSDVEQGFFSVICVIGAHTSHILRCRPSVRTVPSPVHSPSVHRRPTAVEFQLSDQRPLPTVVQPRS
ncbi:hypothetical protein BV898_19709 [Hypsibius exemplaris]|uniref:Uncharacterized protein n=1 Tax=Hypsibius exemplaris TaxID=2072580 RepID=A0A9X6RPW7_HYPEX|nr:hypothetical protein BV898_19709 [Hypsibius exemplaris]